jgi:hypothetical protein
MRIIAHPPPRRRQHLIFLYSSHSIPARPGFGHSKIEFIAAVASSAPTMPIDYAPRRAVARCGSEHWL